MPIRGNKKMKQFDYFDNSVSSDLEGPFFLVRRNSQKSQPNRTYGRWNQKETMMALSLFRRFSDQLESQDKLICWVYFSLISSCVGTRNTNQCRNFYRKLMSKFGSLERGLQSYRLDVKKLQKCLEAKLAELEYFDANFQEILTEKKGKYSMKKGKQGRQKEESSADQQCSLAGSGSGGSSGRMCSMPESYVKIFYSWMCEKTEKSENDAAQGQDRLSFF